MSEITRSAISILSDWYQRNYMDAYEDTGWGLDKTELQDILNRMKPVFFSDFIIRYLLAAHGMPMEIADEIRSRRNAGGKISYETASETMKWLTDMAFEDFVSNGFFVWGEDGVSKKVRCSVNRTYRMGEKMGPLLLDKNGLFGKLMAESVTEDQLFAFGFGLNMPCEDISFLLKKALRRADFNLWNKEEFLLYITFSHAEGDRFRFYQKLKAAFEDPALKPARVRWAEEPGFTTVSVREKTDMLANEIRKQDFHVDLDENGELPDLMIRHLAKYKYLIGHVGDYRRTCLRESLRLLNQFKEYRFQRREALFATGSVKLRYRRDQGLTLPAETFFYKTDQTTGEKILFLLQNEVKIAPKAVPAGDEPLYENEKVLLRSMLPGTEAEEGEITGCSIPDWRERFEICENRRIGLLEKEDEDIAGKYAQGKVMIRYEPELGLQIDAGTVFYKEEEDRRVEFVVENPVRILPGQTAPREVKIELICTKEEKKKQKLEEHYGYITKHSVFWSDNVYLSDMENLSHFKPSRKLAPGETFRMTGKITAKCELGKRVRAGEKFYTVNAKGEEVEFESTNEIGEIVCAEVWVRCKTPGEEATKGEITDCDIENWREKLISIDNTKIGVEKKKEEEKKKKGVLYNYLYSPQKETYDIDGMLDDKDLEKAAAILEGTRLEDNKLNEIETQKAKYINRNDILTLSFLAYASKIEYDFYQGHPAPETPPKEDDPGTRCAGFVESANEVLRKCGFWELYAPNPYDSLLVCLLSSGEAVDAYRNLWGWYLSKKKPRSKKVKADKKDERKSRKRED